MYLLSFIIFEQLALALTKQSCPEIFHCIKYTFYIPEFWEICACPEKQRVLWINCDEYVFFIIQDFWATCTCPEKQSCPGIFHCIEYVFLSFRIFEQLALALKNRVALEFFIVLNMYFLSFRMFEQLALALKREFALKFFKPGGAAAPPRLVRLWTWINCSKIRWQRDPLLICSIVLYKAYFGCKCLRAKWLFSFGWTFCVGVHQKRVNTV